MEDLLKEFYDVPLNDEFIQHSGVAGMKWGKRQYQYEDGSLTPEGREHYGVGAPRKSKWQERREEKAAAKERDNTYKAQYKEGIKKDLTKMSNEELMRAAQRQNLENNYYKALSNSRGAEITKKEKEKKDKITKAVTTGLVTAGSEFAMQYAKKKLTGEDADVGEAVIVGIAKGLGTAFNQPTVGNNAAEIASLANQHIKGNQDIKDAEGLKAEAENTWNSWATANRTGPLKKGDSWYNKSVNDTAWDYYSSMNSKQRASFLGPEAANIFDTYEGSNDVIKEVMNKPNSAFKDYEPITRTSTGATYTPAEKASVQTKKSNSSVYL